MTKQRTFKLIFILLLGTFVLGSCSSSRKMKKKCHDCPEFSQQIGNNPTFLFLDEIA